MASQDGFSSMKLVSKTRMSQNDIEARTWKYSLKRECQRTMFWEE
jgi:hypothetical protein